jgi:hypothetical protein
MSIEVFVDGCTTCGSNAVRIARVKAHYDDVTVFNTRYDGAYQRGRHISFLKQAGIVANQYHAIVVENNGERITLLRQWKPL